MSIQIRQIEASEWNLMKQIRLDALQDSPQAFATSLTDAKKIPDEIWQQRAIEGSVGEKSFCAIGVENDRGIAMAVGLPDFEEPSRTYLVAMWIAKDYRGKGVASKILEQVITWSKQKSSSVLYAGVKCNNLRAEAFYRKMGFLKYKGNPIASRAVCDCGLVLELPL